MNLNTLLLPWQIKIEQELVIRELQNDSRAVCAGDVFLAYPGALSDGRKFIPDAIRRGAVAVLYDPDHCPDEYLDQAGSVPWLAFPDLAQHLGALANRFYGTPTQKLHITGVTGTNGKTTIAYQLAEAHVLLGTTAAYIGTLGEGEPGMLTPLLNTTPDALHLHRGLHGYVSRGIQQVCMEVSSHALEQARVKGLEFTQAIYTNLSHEHLDYHKTLEAYAKAKAKLFAWPDLKTAIINQDDAHAKVIRAAVLPGTQVLTYGLDDTSDVYATQVKLSMTGSIFDVTTPWGNFTCHLKALGAFNVYNGLAVVASLLAGGYAIAEVEAVMPKLSNSPGRMEQVAVSPVVLVDYAHTPDALEHALLTLKPLKRARLIVIVGCGGDRDASKRAVMGRVAEQQADVVILTSDNPRTEDPHAILEAVLSGLQNQSQAVVIENRKEAIQHALKLADAEDMILIAGKGHETYQEIGHERFPFSDKAVVQAVLG